jgi:hypothetical protein
VLNMECRPEKYGGPWERARDIDVKKVGIWASVRRNVATTLSCQLSLVQINDQMITEATKSVCEASKSDRLGS